MRPGVPLQVESIIKTFSAKRAQIPLDVRMTLHVPVQQPLQGETLVAHPATEMTVLGRNRSNFGFVVCPGAWSQGVLVCQGILDAVSAVHEFQLHLGRDAQLKQQQKF